MALAVWALLCVPAALLVRNRPEELGLEPDRPLPTSGGESTGVTATTETTHNWSAHQTWRTAAFWKVVSALATSAMVSTGLVFHQVSILSGRGVTQEAALGLLGVQAFVASVMSVLSGYLADRIPPRHLLSVSMVLMALAIVPLLAVRSPLAALLYSVLLGMHTGIQWCAGSVTLIDFFGRLHFGSVNGIAMSLVIDAAALGPLPLALAQDFLGGYEPALLVLLLFPLASAAAVWSAHPPVAPEYEAVPEK